MKVMKSISLLFSLLLLIVSVGWAQQPSRMTDDEVKKLIDDAIKTSDKFRDAFKKVSSITTRAGVQVDVKQYMKDYQDTFNRFKDSFDSKRTPSSDLLNLFRMTGEIDGDRKSTRLNSSH